MLNPSRRPVVIVIAALVIAGAAYAYMSRRTDSPGAPEGGGGAPESVAVVTAAVLEKPIAVRIEALGTAHANEAVDITSKAGNKVIDVRFDEGQWVRRGEVLVELDGAQDRADLAAAEAALAESRSAYERGRGLFTQQALSQSQLEQIEATLKGNSARVASAAARVADTVIRAPFDGHVGLRRVSVGALVSPGAIITTLDDTRTMKIDFDVPETYLAILKPGLTVAAKSVAYPDESFNGAVESVDSRVDPVARSIKVRARLPNPKGFLRPGMFLTVEVSRDPMPGMVVPEEAVVPERGHVYAFVVADGKVLRREIAIGRRSPGEVEITSGLAAGERVVIEGTQMIQDGSTVHELDRAAAAQ
jgi:membrane fusion protein (multidrug efflux system)